MSIPHDSRQNVTGDFTIVIWVFLKWRPISTAAFIHKGTYPNPINYFFATYSTLPRHYFVFSDTNSYLFPETDTIPLNAWSRWILVRRGSFMGVYRDGTLIQFRNDVSGDPKPSTEPIEVARYAAGASPPCMVDKIRVYSRALDDTEVSRIFQRDELIREGLALCLEFNEYEGNKVYDLGPYGFQGTLYGRYSWVVKKALRTLQI